ncbi:hypothetical protein JKP88DRAFT_303126 [Tribonema minus]|uniref:SAP domain-containing protein n=1 Tax=Tribonema minus TaxID=303371 RepID=A0A835ZB98_9STRA|nr:hypothetical protein JKP88DRAFT_303126 [Tribonema minus]
MLLTAAYMRARLGPQVEADKHTATVLNRVGDSILALEDTHLCHGVVELAEPINVQVKAIDTSKTITLQLPSVLDNKAQGSGPKPSYEAFLAACEPSGFGHRKLTVYDDEVRKALHVPPVRIVATGVDIEALGILDEVRSKLAPFAKLGITAELLKCNVYEKGGFFETHRDTPRDELAFGSLMHVENSGAEISCEVTESVTFCNICRLYTRSDCSDAPLHDRPQVVCLPAAFVGSELCIWNDSAATAEAEAAPPASPVEPAAKRAKTGSATPHESESESGPESESEEGSDEEEQEPEELRGSFRLNWGAKLIVKDPERRSISGGEIRAARSQRRTPACLPMRCAALCTVRSAVAHADRRAPLFDARVNCISSLRTYAVAHAHRRAARRVAVRAAYIPMHLPAHMQSPCSAESSLRVFRAARAPPSPATSTHARATHPMPAAPRWLSTGGEDRSVAELEEDMRARAPRPLLQWAAFYGHCRHRITRVEAGHRITLTYVLRRHAAEPGLAPLPAVPAPPPVDVEAIGPVNAHSDDDYDAMRMPELKDLCRARKVQVSGTKPVLIERLRAYDYEKSESRPEPELMMYCTCVRICRIGPRKMALLAEEFMLLRLLQLMLRGPLQ